MVLGGNNSSEQMNAWKFQPVTTSYRRFEGAKFRPILVIKFPISYIFRWQMYYRGEGGEHSLIIISLLQNV